MAKAVCPFWEPLGEIASASPEILQKLNFCDDKL
jgi:hypothetical protein